MAHQNHGTTEAPQRTPKALHRLEVKEVCWLVKAQHLIRVFKKQFSSCLSLFLISFYIFFSLQKSFKTVGESPDVWLGPTGCRDHQLGLLSTGQLTDFSTRGKFLSEAEALQMPRKTWSARLLNAFEDENAKKH